MRSIAKSENLVAQFERLIAMHRDAPSSFPMPLGTVKSPEGEFAGYIIEFVSGDTLGTLLARGAVAEARKQLASVEVVIAKLHAKNMPHGDINPSNIIPADDGRTLLINPVPCPTPGPQPQHPPSLSEFNQQKT